MKIQSFTLVPSGIGLAAVLLLTACDRPPRDQTAGQVVDRTVAAVEQKAEQAVDGMKQGADVASAKLKDAAITASVNAKLAADPALSAVKIDVDTAAGRVALKGTAPSTVARDDATRLARSVDGVIAVDNQLSVSN